MIDWVLAYWTEILGFATGIACVTLAARRNVWTFPIGIVNNLVLLVVFGAAQFYALAGLQLVYLGFAIHGWLRWARGVEHDRLYVARTPRRAWPWLILAGIAGAALLWWLLSTFTDSTVPLADAATTSASLVAQYLLNRKRIENWYVWIGVDVASVVLFLATGLFITAALYLVLLGLCIYGLLSWRRIEKATEPAPENVAVAGG